MKDLLSKEHYCYAIHTSFSPFMDTLLPPPYDISKISTPYK